MPAITVKAHYDGRTIQLDESIELMPNARLLVTVLEPAGEIDTDWSGLAASGLAGAFGDDEPEYGPADVLPQ
jgi:hypothetical protein